MPIIRDVSLNLPMEQVLRRQGIGGRAKVRLQIMSLLNELLATVNALHLLEPAIAYQFYLVVELHHERLRLGGGGVLHGSLLPSLLALARELALVVCTIGPHLEEKKEDYVARGDLLRAVLLDGIGSAAVDVLAQEACRLIQHEAASRGYKASSPLSPGVRGFPLSEQRQLFRLVPAGQIGVRLTSGEMMVPCKSVSMAIGLGPRMPTWTQLEVCNRCNLKDTCRYRVHNHAEAAT